jgi:uncharacterized membrane protein YjgN (DUF898 family)
MSLDTAGVAPASPPRTSRVRFTGTGAGYFRVWAINLLACLLTVGLYLPWARLRKQRWFARHTHLDGDPLEVEGQPWRMLVGLIVGYLTVLAWGWSWSWSPWIGLGLTAALLALHPVLFHQGLRFRLSRTHWRGVRLGFDADYGAGLIALLPLGLCIVTLPAVSGWSGVSGPGPLAALVMVPLALLLPWAHARAKAHQWRHSRLGERRFEFEDATLAFYGVYVAGLLALVALLMLWSLAAAVAVTLGPGRGVSPAVVRVLVVASALLGLSLMWPWLAALMQRSVWGRLRWGDWRLRADIAPGRHALRVAGHMGLTVLSLGLWWPWAAVAIARERLQAIEVSGPVPLSALVLPGRTASAPGAVAEAAQGDLNLDLGW